jgi:hypothetical protein
VPERLRLRELLHAADPAFRRAYALLQRTFPPTELVKRSEFLRTFRERAAGVWTDFLWHMVVGEKGKTLLGCATGSYIGSLNVGLIGYLAVAPGLRSHGLGPRLRERLRQAFDASARRLHGHGVDAIIGEVEADNPWLGRLVRYYGAIPLDLLYFQPPVRPAEPVVPLVLYYQPLRRERRRLPVAEVRRILYAIWRRAYRIAAPVEDARFRRMLQSLDGRRWIGALELPPARPLGPVRE